MLSVLASLSQRLAADTLKARRLIELRDRWQVVQRHVARSWLKGAVRANEISARGITGGQSPPAGSPRAQCLPRGGTLTAASNHSGLRSSRYGSPDSRRVQEHHLHRTIVQVLRPSRSSHCRAAGGRLVPSRALRGREQFPLRWGTEISRLLVRPVGHRLYREL